MESLAYAKQISDNLLLIDMSGNSRDISVIAEVAKDGRATVALKFFDGRSYLGKRNIPVFLVMRSKGANFTQDQLDAIKAFSQLGKLIDFF